MGFPVFVNVAGGGFSSGTSNTPTMVGSIVINNLLISVAAVHITGQTFSITGATGWTIPVSANSGACSIALAYKLAVGADAAPTWNWGSSAPGYTNVFQYSGNSTGSPPVGATSSTSGTATSGGAPQVTTTNPNSLIFNYHYGFYNNGSFTSSPTNYTQITFTNNGSFGTFIASQGPVGNSGSLADATTITFPSSSGFAQVTAELFGTGASLGDHQRATQNDLQVLEQITAVNVRATQVVLQVLRTQAAISIATRRTLSPVGTRTGSRQPIVF